MDKDTAAMITAVRKSIQEAYNITKVLEQVAEEGDKINPEAKQMYWDILYDCAKHIRLNLDEYSLGYVPVDPFDEEDGNLHMKGKITNFTAKKKRRGRIKPI